MSTWIYVILVVLVLSIIGIIVYAYWGRYILDYKRAKKDVIPFVESYKRKCTGDNRFIVTVETLQDSFREYDVRTIKKVWGDLIEMKLIEKDVVDGEWCIR